MDKWVFEIDKTTGVQIAECLTDVGRNLAAARIAAARAHDYSQTLMAIMIASIPTGPLAKAVPVGSQVVTAFGENKSPLLASKRTWKQHGQSGIWVSDWLPKIAECMDEIAVVRSCWADGINHSAGVCQMNTCSILSGRPSLGSWVSYGLGTENENLPAFVVMQVNGSQVVNGPRNWGPGFMPAVYQGIRFREGKQPIPYFNSPEGIDGKGSLVVHRCRSEAMAETIETLVDGKV